MDPFPELTASSYHTYRNHESRSNYRPSTRGEAREMSPSPSRRNSETEVKRRRRRKPKRSATLSPCSRSPSREDELMWKTSIGDYLLPPPSPISNRSFSPISPKSRSKRPDLPSFM